MVFSVIGYWKDDRTEFYGYLVTDYDSVPDGYTEEEIFFFGLNENDLKNSSEDDALDFVITAYTILE